ncbi:MAG TPA: hypothetical protein VGL55_12005 [Steroidobacteraceae bacterium]
MRRYEQLVALLEGLISLEHPVPRVCHQSTTSWVEPVRGAARDVLSATF